uniref:N-acetyltransferase n=1 Tax=Ignisphaera aggregans TaxID=334771 RepID=A0A7J3JQY0_9CREN
MILSFGIEFEFDIIKSNGETIHEMFRQGYKVTDSWSYQEDMTAGVELRTPVLLNLEEAVESIKQQFRYWCNALRGYAPYAYNTPLRSLGQHIHLGNPSRGLNRHEKQIIAYSIAKMYPLLAGIHAQPIPSRRGLSSNYTRPIYTYNSHLPIFDHYAEISESHHGTVEFRIFDSNIPQVTLTCIYLMKNVVEKMLETNDVDYSLDMYRYYLDRNNVLRYGLKSINLKQYLNYIINIVTNDEIPNIPCIRELLYLAFKYGKNAFNILSELDVDKYKYFKKMFTNPSNFVDNIFAIIDMDRLNNSIKSILQDVHQNAERLDSLSKLANLTPNINYMIEIPHHSRELPLRTEVKRKIENYEYSILRISDFYETERYDIIDRIIYLQKYHGDSFVRILTHQEILELPHRFYVFVVSTRDSISDRYRDVVLGAIGVRVRTGEIISLVVDRRYRRLGIAKRLLRKAISVCEENPYAYVRRDNIAMIRLLESMGFVKEEETKDCYKYVLRRE